MSPVLEITMIRFECDWCRNLKNSDETWILGLAAEAVGVTAARREVTILSAWTREASLDPLAVHFCSEQCKSNYMAALFDQEPARLEIVGKSARKSGSRRRRSAVAKGKSRRSARKKSAA